MEVAESVVVVALPGRAKRRDDARRRGPEWPACRRLDGVTGNKAVRPTTGSAMAAISCHMRDFPVACVSRSSGSPERLAQNNTTGVVLTMSLNEA